METNTQTTLDLFTRGYVMAALFTFDDDAPSGDYERSGRFEILFPLIDPETLQKMIADCVAFQAQADLTDYPTERAGNDFWYTRNGHGVGFWEEDYGTPEQCAKLTALSKTFREVDLYYGDDKKIYA